MFQSIDMPMNSINGQIIYPLESSIEPYVADNSCCIWPSNLNENDNYLLNDIEMENTSQKTYLKQKTKREDNKINDNEMPINNNNDLDLDYNNNEHINNNSIEIQSIIPNINNNIEILDMHQNSNNNNNNEEKEITRIEINNDMGMNNENEEKLKSGRKTDEDKKNGKNGKHTKNSEDNIIRKIKSFFGKSLYKFIKNSFINEEDLLKLEIDVNKCLKKDYNEKLFETKLRDLFMLSNISVKYKLKKVKTNEQLISKVYQENKEKAVIKILDLTYIDAFNIFRRKLMNNQAISLDLKRKIEGTNILDINKFQDAEVFRNKIYLEEIKKGGKKEDIVSYLNDVKNLILNFENWFANKVGRNR